MLSSSGNTLSKHGTLSAQSTLNTLSSWNTQYIRYKQIEPVSKHATNQANLSPSEPERLVH